jgi:hypothetical protein
MRVTIRINVNVGVNLAAILKWLIVARLLLVP